MKKVILYKSDITDPAYNLALEEYLLSQQKDDELIILLWQNDKTVVIGRHQNAYVEVDTDFATSNGIKIVKRNSGGGAVYHDLGNMNYSFIMNSSIDYLDYCKDIIIKVFSKCGVNAFHGGKNDIFVDGYKVSGTAKYEYDGKILYHGTILMNTDLEVLRKVLTRNTKPTKSFSIESVENKVANLVDLSKRDISFEMITNYFEDITGLSCELIDIDSIAAIPPIMDLVTEKYNAHKWNYG